MNSRPLEGLFICFVWVALWIAMKQVGTHKRIHRDASEKAPVVTSTKLKFRFTLRTLMIATTLVAVIVAVVVYTLK